MAPHQLRASPQTVRIGVFDATFPPVLTIESGDRVLVQCVSGREDVMPPGNSGLTVPPELDAILKANPGARAGQFAQGRSISARRSGRDRLERSQLHHELDVDAAGPYGQIWGG